MSTVPNVPTNFPPAEDFSAAEYFSENMSEGFSSDDENYFDENDFLDAELPKPSPETFPVPKMDPLLACQPDPLSIQYWSEPKATSFRTRTKTYMRTRKKLPSGQNFFRLITVDLVKVEKPIKTGLCLHPEERVQQWLKREAEKAADGNQDISPMPPFIFCVNIIVPGKQNFHALMYYAVDDISLIKGDINNQANDDPEGRRAPFAKLASKFFFGSSDDFRNSTFKLVPRIVKGNVLVKKAVGSKPTIMGRKLKQYYVRHERFFELIIDVGSSSVAEKIVKLAAGYAKTLVVDMAFLLEGKDSTTLPENVMGTVRFTNLNFKANLRTVEDPSNNRSS